MRPAKENQFEQRDYLLAKLKNNFASLSPKFQTAARYMLDNPQEVPISSMRKIALYAGVQPSTLVRLAQLLGFDGWQGLRDVFAAAIRNGPQPYSNHAKQVVRANSTARMLSNIVDAQQKNLELWRSTGQENLSQAADLLAAA